MSPTDRLRQLFLCGAWLAALLLAAGARGEARPLDLRAPLERSRSEDARARVELVQAPPGDRSRFASFETRLLRIEEELRALTGRIEELEHRNRQLERQLEALATREPGTPASPSAAAVAAPPASGEAGPSPQPPETTAPLAVADRGPEPAPAGEEEAPQPGRLPGTIPAEVLRGEEGAGGTPAVAEGPAAEGTESVAAPDARLRAALEGSADERYRAALDLLEAGDFEAAELAFSRFVEDFPDDPRAPTAAFWLGETHFFRQDFATAATVYARNYRRYGPDAPRAADTLLKLGMALAALGDRERACRTFAELERRHPDAPAPIRQMLRRERTAAGCD